MKRLMIAAAAAVLMIVPLTVQREAAAADAIAWNSSPCIEPGFSEFEVDSSSRQLVLWGYASQCAPTVASGGFRLATYYPDKESGSAPGYNVRLFRAEAVGNGRDFGAVVVPNTAGTYGVCFLAGAEERVACKKVVVGTTGRGWYGAMSDIALDDPLVNRPVVAGTYTGGLAPTPGRGPNGGCGTCF